MTLPRTTPAVAILAALAAMAAMAAPAQAKEGRAAIVQKLVDCRKVADSAARLACYDQTAADLDQAEAKGDVVIVDREQATEVRRQAFGFTLPSLSLFNKGAPKEEIESADGVVAGARRDGNGRWAIVLEGGAVWTQVGSEELFKTPKAGMKVRIRRGALGSFLMSVDNSGAFKAHRVQ